MVGGGGDWGVGDGCLGCLAGLGAVMLARTSCGVTGVVVAPRVVVSISSSANSWYSCCLAAWDMGVWTSASAFVCDEVDWTGLMSVSSWVSIGAV